MKWTTTAVACCLAALLAAVTAAQPGDEPGDTTFAPPISGELYTFDGDADLTHVKGNGTTFEFVPGKTGKALAATYKAGVQYPNVALNPPRGAWNLSPFAGVQVEVTNKSGPAVDVVLRVDNPTSKDAGAWNGNKVRIKPGETKLIQVTFGQSWGGVGYPLRPGRVVATQVYLESPKQDQVLVIDNLKAFGTAQARDTEQIGPAGEMFTFDDPLDVVGLLENRGAEAKVVGGALEVRFGTGEQYPSVRLLPIAKKWDLSIHESVQADVTNRGTGPVRVLLRVDNPDADGTTNCNTEAAELAAGETKTIKVTFGRSWGNPAFALDRMNVVGLLVFADQPRQAATIVVDNVKANRQEWAALPDWLGTRPPVDGDWVKTLDENFDGPKLDPTRWTPRLVWDGPAGGELQRYVEGNVTVENGLLKIKCEKRPGHQYDNPKLDRREYTTGAVTSYDKWTQTYGYIESRIKLPTARGLWPAFWTMPDRGATSGLDVWARRNTGAGGMEVDVLEHLTEWGDGRYNVATHWDGYGDDHRFWGQDRTYFIPTRDGWHVWGLLWEPGKLTWYCDGVKKAEWTSDRVTALPMYLKYTVQMGNWATTDVDDAKLPDYLQVDWVRAWQLRSRLDAAAAAAAPAAR